MIQRQHELDVLRTLLRRNGVVAIVGAAGRQDDVVRMIAAEYRGAVSYFDLENPEDLARLAEPCWR